MAEACAHFQELGDADSATLPSNAIECPICAEVVEDAVACERCHNFLCLSHVEKLQKCPLCQSIPFQARPDYSLRRLIAQIPTACPNECGTRVPRGELGAHVSVRCPLRPRTCGANECGFVTRHRTEALRHVCDTHGERLWEEFAKATAAVVNGPESVCSTCVQLTKEVERLRKENKLLREKITSNNGIEPVTEEDWPNDSGAPVKRNIHFSPMARTPGVRVFGEGRKARHDGNDRTPQLVLASASSRVFKLRVVSNPQHTGLCIGFCPPDIAPSDFSSFRKSSWRLCTMGHALYEPEHTGAESRYDVLEGAVVSVVKNSKLRALRFLVNGSDVLDVFGNPYGWRATDLDVEHFAALVGAVEFRWKGDQVEILE